MYPSKRHTVDEEIESWKGFPWALRKEDVEVWDRMTRGAREHEYAIKKSGRWLTTEPFFIAILLLQYKTIRSLEGEAERLKKLRRDGKTTTDGVPPFAKHRHADWRPHPLHTREKETHPARTGCQPDTWYSMTMV